MTAQEGKCRKQASVYVTMKSDCASFVPTAFSPNGDNINDKLMFYPSNCVKQIKRIAIFNRWGNLILSKSNIAILGNQEVEIWDGLIDGKQIELNTFVYFLEAEYTNGKTEVLGGDFTILR